MFDGLKVLAASPTKLNRMASDQESDNNSLGSPSPFKNNKKRPIFIGIAGGTASGKTTVCEEIYDRVQINAFKHCVMIPLDCFYKECTPEQMANIGSVNFDHPSMFDWPLLKETFKQL